MGVKTAVFVVTALLTIPVTAAAAAPEDRELLVLDGNKVRKKYVRALPPVSASEITQSMKLRATYPRIPEIAGNRAGAAAKKRTVTRAIKDAYDKGSIDLETRDRYLRIYRRAISTWKRLGFTRKKELGSVLAEVQRLARLKKLNGGRMAAVLLELDRNREWWGAKGAPGSGARVSFDGSLIVFQYYPGQGLRIQVLANCGTANGYWAGGKKDKLRKLLDELIGLQVEKSAPGGVRFKTIEYYFPFGGGKPPWFSAMAQATCIQALARAGVSLNDPSYHRVAESMLPIFLAKTPRGVKVKRAGGNWYALYNFSPSLRVLNGHLQTLIGLHDLFAHSGNRQALDLFNKGDTAAVNQLARYDTGAWSLYSPGREADLNYHKLQRDFLSRLCRRVKETFARPANNIYCTTASRFTSYLKTPPTLTSVRVAPAPVRQGKRTAVRFTLSKISRIGLTVKNGKGEVVFATSAGLSRGSRRIYWRAPDNKTGSYGYSLSAVDLAGNKSEPVRGNIRIIKARKQKRK